MSRPLRLLLLEDSPADAELLVCELRHEGYECDWVRVQDESGFRAALSPDLDLILADYSLPQYSARRALVELKARGLNIPFIVVTGAAGEETAVECVRLGATDYLMKDRLVRFPEAVARALEDRRIRVQSRDTKLALRESEDRFRRLAENAQDIIFRYRVVEPHGFEFVSKAATDILGYSPEEFYDDPELATKLIHPADRGTLAHAAATLSLDGLGEMRWTGKDGRTVWTELRFTPVHDDGGALVALEGIVRDISRRRESEQEVYLAAQVLERVASLVLVADRHGEIVYASPSVERLLGFKRAEVLGRGWWRLSRSTAAQGDSERERLARAADPTGVFQTEPYELPLVDSWGRARWFEWHDERGPGDTIVGVGRDITERKLAEEERRMLLEKLAGSEARYRAIVEQMPAVTYAAPIRGHSPALYVSPQVQPLLGVHADAVSGPDGWFNRIHPEDRHRFLDVARSIRRGRGSHVTEYRMLHRSGHVVWVRDEGALVHDPDGRPLCVQGVVVDISDRKAAEQALQDSKHALQTLIDASPLPILEVDATRRVRVWNAAAERLFGWTAGEVLGRPNPILPDEYHNEYVSHCERAVAGERVVTETRRRKKDGTLIDVILSVAPIFDSDGIVSSIVAIVADVSARVKAEALLRQREEHFRSLIENARDIIVVIDAKGLISYVSPSVERVLGRRVEDILGTSAAEWVHESDREIRRTALHAVRAGSPHQNALTVRVRHSDNSFRCIEVIATVGHPEDPNAVIVNSRDVTERNNLEQQLRQAQKMEAVGQLAGGVAHDFNNVLTAVLGYGQLVRQQLPDGTPLAADVDEIVKAGERAAALTKQLLAFSRKQVLEPTSLNLNELISDFQKMLGRVIGEHVRLQPNLDPAIGPINADRSQIQQVLLNLGVNARDAMPQGGTLKIETARVTVAQASTSSPAIGPGPWIRLTVTDTGCGMSQEVVSRIFEPFFTTKALGKGTGLGLSTVYGIVTQTGGHITVDTEIGRGTRFCIYVPEAGSPVVRGPAERREPAPTTGSETVLVVEDEAGIRGLVRRTLEKQGYVVLEAGSAQTAADVEARHAGNIDLLLSDIVMPGGSGVELAQRLIGRRPAMRVMHMSGFALAAPPEKLSSRTAFLHKPFSAETLLRRVRACLDRDVAGSRAQ